MSEHLKALTDNPELADGFTAEEVAEARAELNDFKDAVKAGEQEAGSEAIAEAKAIAERLTERETALQVEAEARQAEIDALEEALGGKPEEDDDDDEEADEEDSVEVPDTPAEIVEEEVVVAAAPSGNLKGLKSRVPAERKPSENTGPVLVASAAQYAGQDILTASALGEMFSRSWKGLPDTAVSTPFRLASFNTEGQHKYTVKAGDDEGNFRALAELTEDASENGNLVAAGGFCAPPQPLYTFFNIASRAGILNLPTVNAPRGSISLPTSPSLGDFLGQSGIATEWTDENDEEPTTPATKPVFIIDCPPFTTCEVSAWPTIIQAGNFATAVLPRIHRERGGTRGDRRRPDVERGQARIHAVRRHQRNRTPPPSEVESSVWRGTWGRRPPPTGVNTGCHLTHRWTLQRRIGCPTPSTSTPSQEGRPWTTTRCERRWTGFSDSSTSEPSTSTTWTTWRPTGRSPEPPTSSCGRPALLSNSTAEPSIWEWSGIQR